MVRETTPELANGPVTPASDRVLFDRGVFLVPDILANAGGVTVSYYEWVQDMYSYFWTEDRVRDTLEQTMETAADAHRAIIPRALAQVVPKRANCPEGGRRAAGTRPI